jgi:hypothetical protein
MIQKFSFDKLKQWLVDNRRPTTMVVTAAAIVGVVIATSRKSVGAGMGALVVTLVVAAILWRLVRRYG